MAGTYKRYRMAAFVLIDAAFTMNKTQRSFQ